MVGKADAMGVDAAKRRNAKKDDGKKKVDVMTSRVINKHSNDVREAVPTGIVSRAMFRRKNGDPDDMALRKSMLGAADSRQKRDLDLIGKYGADAERSRSFQSGMKNGGKVSKMAGGGMCRGMGAARKGGKFSRSA